MPVTRASSTSCEITEMEKMHRDMMEMVQQMQKKIDDHMVMTRASNTDSEMVAMQRDILEMIQQLPQKIGDTEAHITNSIDIKCSALEDNVKQYINSVVFAYIDNLMHHVIIPTTDSTSHSSQASETVSLANEETSGDLNGDRETNINSKEHKDGETTTLTGFEPAITRPKLPIHDVYIGGASPTTTEDDLRVYLLKIGITPESIMSIECISGGDPQSSSFRVKILKFLSKTRCTIHQISKLELSLSHIDSTKGTQTVTLVKIFTQAMFHIHATETKTVVAFKKTITELLSHHATLMDHGVNTLIHEILADNVRLMTELVTEADTLNTLDLNTPVDVMKTEKHGI